MRLILLAFVVCASIMAEDSTKTIEVEAMNATRTKPNAATAKHPFHPLRLLRRLGRAESEFAFRLSSWRIEREVESGDSQALARPSPLKETAKSMPQGPLGGASW